jgi:hypothetical protein
LRAPSRKCLPKRPTIIWKKKKILVVVEKKKALRTRFLLWLGYVKAISDIKFPVSTVLFDCLQHSLPTRVPTRLQAALVNFYRFPHVLLTAYIGSIHFDKASWIVVTAALEALIMQHKLIWVSDVGIARIHAEPAQKFDLCSWTSRKSVFDENKITKININTALTVVHRRQQNFKMIAYCGGIVRKHNATKILNFFLLKIKKLCLYIILKIIF